MEDGGFVEDNNKAINVNIRITNMMMKYCFNGVGGSKNHNGLPDNSNKPSFLQMKACFWLNIDETCIIANDRNIKVFGAKYKIIASKIRYSYKLLDSIVII